MRLGRRLACETAAKWVVAGWAQLAFGKRTRRRRCGGFFWQEDGLVQSTAIRVMMRGGNVWCLHRVLAARGHAGGAAASRTRVQNPPSAPQQTKIACGKSKPTTSWCGATGVQCGLTESHRLPIWAAVTVCVAVLKFGENSFPKRMVRAGHGPVHGAIGPGARPFGVGDCDVVPELFHEHAIREIVEGWNRISLPPLSPSPRPRPRAAWQTCPMEQVGRWEAPGQES